MSLEVRYIRVIGDGYTKARFSSRPCTVLNPLDIDIDVCLQTWKIKADPLTRGGRLTK